ncbi:MAG: hypothetical protein IKN64_11945 [Desulfovibrio sp.]|nr:hypothetical protein [Desulfovibrio sp.]
MKTLLLSLALMVISASSASAWSLRMDGGDVRYECRQLGSDIECRANGKVFGWAKQRGSDIIYTDSRNSTIGSVSRMGNKWQFKGSHGATLGYAEREGHTIVYKNGSGRILGYAKREGARTTYTNAGNSRIGTADTDALPLRPLPLETWLKNGGR